MFTIMDHYERIFHICFLLMSAVTLRSFRFHCDMIAKQRLRNHVISLNNPSNVIDAHEMLMIDWVNGRNWSKVNEFWRNIILNPSIAPLFVKGQNEKYQISHLREITEIGKMGEFSSKNPRYLKRRTYALRLGYDGSVYRGYQYQPFQKTVEGDLNEILGRKSTAAGRTDKEVSAIGQVVSFVTTEVINENDLLERVNTFQCCKEGHIKIFECAQVPRKFNGRSQAAWRRYLYLIPITKFDDNTYDIDVAFIQTALTRIEGKSLPFNAFAFREDRTQGEGMKDNCTLFYTRAYEVELYAENHALCIELVGNRFLRHMVRKISSTVIREQLKPVEERNIDILLDICESGNRLLTARPLPGLGLCLAGVGFDAYELAIYKYMTRVERNYIDSIYNKTAANLIK